MSLTLNEKQVEKLADFTFDIAKGLLLGSAGFAAIAQTEGRVFLSFIGGIFALAFVIIGLNLLKHAWAK